MGNSDLTMKSHDSADFMIICGSYGGFYDHIVNYEKTHKNEVQRPIPFDAVLNSLQHIKKLEVNT